MPDGPPSVTPIPQKSSVGSYGPNASIMDASHAQNLAISAGATWPAANRALYVGVWIEQPCIARRLWTVVTIQSGNLDIGLYDAKGNRIVSKGSTAVGAAGTQVIDITASVTGTASPVLMPGNYFIALNVDNTTAAIKSVTLSAAEMCRICGVQQQAVGAVTLPSTATFANPASAYVPLVGLFTGTVL